MAKFRSHSVKNIDDFVVTSPEAKSQIQGVIRYVTRESNRCKFNYRQLRYIFRMVRLNCDIEIPNQKTRKLKELPNQADLARFYASIDNPVHRLMFETLENTGLRVA